MYSTTIRRNDSAIFLFFCFFCFAISERTLTHTQHGRIDPELVTAVVPSIAKTCSRLSAAKKSRYVSLPRGSDTRPCCTTDISLNSRKHIAPVYVQYPRPARQHDAHESAHVREREYICWHYHRATSPSQPLPTFTVVYEVEVLWTAG